MSENTTTVGKAEWEIIERRLSAPYECVRLVCDGYAVSLYSMVIKRRVETMVYVGGKFLGAWLTEDCEERRRFMRRSVLKPSAACRRFEAEIRRITRRKPKPRAPTFVYSMLWTSPRELTRHLRANNRDVRLVLE